MLEQFLELPLKKFVTTVRLFYKDLFAKYSDHIPFELSPKEMEEISGITSLLDQYCDENDYDTAKLTDFASFLLTLPLSIIVETKTFSELMLSENYSKQLRTELGEFKYTSFGSIITLINNGVLQSENYYSNQKFIKKLVKKSEHGNSKNRYQTILNSLLDYAHGLDDKPFRNYISEFPKQSRESKLYFEMFTSTRLKSFVSSDTDISLFPIKLLDQHQKQLQKYLKKHLDEIESYFNLLDIVEPLDALTLCIKNNINYPGITRRSDISKIIHTYLKKPKTKGAPDLLRDYVKALKCVESDQFGSFDLNK